MPLVLAAAVYGIMLIWHLGATAVSIRLQEQVVPVGTFMAEIAAGQIPRVPGAAVFLTRTQRDAPPVMVWHLKHNRALHERLFVLTVDTEPIPWVQSSERLAVQEIAPRFWRASARYGFMEHPDIPALLRQASEQGCAIDLADVTYYVGHETVTPRDGAKALPRWVEALFALMQRNSAHLTDYFKLPPDAVVEIGRQIGRACRNAWLRIRESGGCGRAPDDRLLWTYRQLGDRHACRRPARDLGCPDLPRRQQSADGPHDCAVPRRSGRICSKGRRSRAAAITALRRGTHLGLLADQKMNDGIPVPFFGRPAMIAPALAVCDVLPLRVERLDGARFRVTVFPPLPLPRSGEPPANVAALMAEVNATLEAWIRDRPEQWLWVHQRWPDCCCYLNRYLYTGDLSQRNTNGIHAEPPYGRRKLLWLRSIRVERRTIR